MKYKIKECTILIIIFFMFTFGSIGASLVIDYQQLIASFQSDVATVNKRFTQQISNIGTVLLSVSGLHHASDNLNQAELSSFSSEMLKAYPFIGSVISMEKVTVKNIKEFEQRMQKLGYVGLNIKEYDNDQNTKLKNFYLPVNFIEPMTPTSANLLGLDILSMPEMREVIAEATSSGEVSASKIKTFNNFKEPSVFIFKSIYLGRYPPKEMKEREEMLDGVVALNVGINQFIKHLNLQELNLTGALINLTDYKSSSWDESFNFSISLFEYAEKMYIYGKSYGMTLQRSISIDMISKGRAVIFWIIAMFFLAFFTSYFNKRKASANEIRYLAYYDSLTCLPNRESFKEKLGAALKKSRKNATMGAILFIDVDEFKRINDTLGHDVGDELLKQISARLTHLMRQGDALGHVEKNSNKTTDIFIENNATNDLVTRLGGDEFTVLLTDINNSDVAGAVSNRILQRISKPFKLDGHDVFVTSSIGIALFPKDGNGIDDLLKHADTAMYHAKNTGKNNYQFYAENMTSKIERRLNLEEKLHQAIKKNEFQLFYQPQVDSKTNKIIAAEALIRWQQCELGMILPDDFIPLAEETGQIFKIGEWVINEACQQNKKWQESGYDFIRVAINLSSMQLMQDGLVDFIRQTLISAELDAKYLELEITEGIMMRNIEQTILVIKEFNDMNINVSVDDFGTGYSSLSYLKKFPLKSLKIDKSFVMDIPKDKDDMMITSAIISMAKSLDLQVIAEGVENQQQVDFLKSHKCDLMQGYFFSHPVPAAEFEKLLANQSKGLKSVFRAEKS